MNGKHFPPLTPVLLGAMFLLLMTSPAISAVLLSGAALQNPLGTLPGVADYTLSGIPAGYSLFAQLLSTYTGTIGGQVASSVYKNNVTGELAFAYRFTNTTATGTPLVQATIGGSNDAWFDTAIYNAGADSFGMSTPAASSPNWSNGNPYIIERESVAEGSGIRLVWQFLNSGTNLAGPTGYSSLIWFTTNAKDYVLTNVAVTDTGAASLALALAPASVPVPEPSSLVLHSLGLGILGLVFSRHRKR